MQKSSSASGYQDRLDQLRESAGVMKDRMMDAKDAVVEGGSAAIKKTGNLIKDHPILAIGIAFGIGYLAMRLMRR